MDNAPEAQSSAAGLEGIEEAESRAANNIRLLALGSVAAGASPVVVGAVTTNATLAVIGIAGACAVIQMIALASTIKLRQKVASLAH